MLNTCLNAVSRLCWQLTFGALDAAVVGESNSFLSAVSTDRRKALLMGAAAAALATAGLAVL